MHRVVMVAILAALTAGCRDTAKESNERADRALAQVSALQRQVADLEVDVANLGQQLEELDPRGPDVGDGGPEFEKDLAGYAAARSPASALSMRATVRSTPKMATKEPKRGPVVCPSSTS
jgi:hypothetical protein